MSDLIRTLKERLAPAGAERRSNPRFAVGHGAHLLMRLSASEGGEGAVLAGTTRDVGQSGLAVAVEAPPPSALRLAVGDHLELALELHGAGLVEMRAEVVRVERPEAGGELLLGLRIADMMPTERAAYEEYLRSKGWEIFTGVDAQ